MKTKTPAILALPILALLCLIAAANGAVAQPAAPPSATDRGFAFVTENCARCHAVGPTGDSPLVLAPRFRDLHLRYPVEYLEEALAEGILTGHPEMPQFVLDPAEIADVIAYLKTLE